MTVKDRAKETVDKLRSAKTDNERIVRGQKIIGTVGFGIAVGGLALNWLVARNWLGLFPNIDPSVQLLVLEVGQLMTGAGIGLTIGIGLAWKDANKLIANVANGANTAIEALQREMSALALAYQSIQKALADALGNNEPPDESGRLNISERWIEICHALDAAAARAEIRFADGGTFVDDQHALILMHTFRLTYPAYSADEKAMSRDWLKARNLDADLTYGLTTPPPKERLN